MKSKKNILLVGIFVSIFLLLLAIYVKGNWSYWEMSNSYKKDIKSYGRTIMSLKNANREVDIALELLNNTDYKPGEILDVNNRIVINGTKIILDKFIYLYEYKELHCGIIIKPSQGLATQQDINFYLENNQQTISERSIYEKSGYNGIFQKTHFRNVELSDQNEYSFIIEVNNIKTEFIVKMQP
ncbi:MAG: hypothetical protein PHC69_08520 [Ruminiclostridium sp.]|nr:hypothetical protein [Ruminiclostridium sp.]